MKRRTIAIIVWLALCGVALAEDSPVDAEQARQIAMQGYPERAFLELQELAASGDATAQLYAGIMLAAGEGTGVDVGAAAALWRSAAEQNLAEAQYRLGLAYAAGQGVELDPVEGAKWLILARVEDGLAFQTLATALSEGQMSESRSRATEWRAQNQRARLTVALDPSSALEGTERTEAIVALAQEGVAEAQFEAGRLYEFGRRGDDKSATFGNPSGPLGGAQVAAQLRAVGENLLGYPEQNLATAERYYRLAAEAAYVPAMLALARLHGGSGTTPEDISEALLWYRTAAELGDADGKWGVARLLLESSRSTDHQIAVSLLSEVSAMGSRYYDAQAELAAILSESGQDLRTAYMWYAVAAFGARLEGMTPIAAAYDRDRLQLESFMSSSEIEIGRAMAGKCWSSQYKTCRPPQVFDLLGH